MKIEESRDGDIWEVSNDEERIEITEPQTEPDREREEVVVG